MQSLELQVNLLLEEEVDEGTRQLWLKTFSEFGVLRWYPVGHETVDERFWTKEEIIIYTSLLYIY